MEVMSTPAVPRGVVWSPALAPQVESKPLVRVHALPQEILGVREGHWTTLDRAARVREEEMNLRSHIALQRSSHLRAHSNNRQVLAVQTGAQSDPRPEEDSPQKQRSEPMHHRAARFLRPSKARAAVAAPAIQTISILIRTLTARRILVWGSR